MIDVITSCVKARIIPNFKIALEKSMSLRLQMTTEYTASKVPYNTTYTALSNNVNLLCKYSPMLCSSSPHYSPSHLFHPFSNFTTPTTSPNAAMGVHSSSYHQSKNSRDSRPNKSIDTAGNGRLGLKSQGELLTHYTNSTKSPSIQLLEPTY